MKVVCKGDGTTEVTTRESDGIASVTIAGKTYPVKPGATLRVGGHMRSAGMPGITEPLPHPTPQQMFDKREAALAYLAAEFKDDKQLRIIYQDGIADMLAEAFATADMSDVNNRRALAGEILALIFGDMRS